MQNSKDGQRGLGTILVSPWCAMLLRGVWLALLSATLGLVAPSARGANTQPIQVGTGQKTFPESVTSTAAGEIFVGSMTQGFVLRAASGDTIATTFVPSPTEGPKATLGLLADERTGLLWVCYSDLANFAGLTGLPAELRAFDLKTGAQRARYPMSPGSVCSDIATLPDGTVYATDIAGGRIFRLKKGAHELEEFFADSKLRGSIDGIAVDTDGSLYVTDLRGSQLLRVDLTASGEVTGVTPIKLSMNVRGPDGMRFDADGILYLAENAAGRVDAITITGDSATVRPLKNGYDGPTAVSPSGHTLFVLEGKVRLFGGDADPGNFYVYSLPIPN